MKQATLFLLINYLMLSLCALNIDSDSDGYSATQTQITFPEAYRRITDSYFMAVPYGLLIPDSLLIDKPLNNLIINPQNDTIYMIKETYQDHQPSPHISILVWNKHGLEYTSSYINNDTHSKSKKELLRSLKRSFMKKVEMWDTLYLRSKEHYRFASGRHHSYLTQIVFYNNKVKTQTFKYWDFDIPLDDSINSPGIYNPMYMLID